MTTRKNVFTFFLGCALLNLAANFAHPVTPTIFTDLQLSDYIFGVVLAAQLFTNFLFSPFWGKLSTYLSSKTVLFITLIGYALGQFWFAVARSELDFVLARAFTGVFIGGSFVCMLTYIVNTSPNPQMRGKYLAVYATVQMTSMAFGYTIGGLLGEISTYLAIYAQIVVLLLSGLCFFIFCENDKKDTLNRQNRTALFKEANPLAAFISSRKIMTATFFLLFMTCMLSNLGFTAFDQTFNYYLRDQFGFSSGYNGIIKGVMGLITFIVNSTLTIYLINRTDSKKSVIWVLLACAISMISATLTDNLPLFLVFNVLYFAANSITLPLLQSLVAQRGETSDSNLVMGVYNAMRSLGAVIGALFAGFLYNIAPKTPFFFGFFAFVLATVCALLYRKRSKLK